MRGPSSHVLQIWIDIIIAQTELICKHKQRFGVETLDSQGIIYLVSNLESKMVRETDSTPATLGGGLDELLYKLRTHIDVSSRFEDSTSHSANLARLAINEAGREMASHLEPLIGERFKVTGSSVRRLVFAQSPGQDGQWQQVDESEGQTDIITDCEVILEQVSSFAMTVRFSQSPEHGVVLPFREVQAFELVSDSE